MNCVRIFSLLFLAVHVISEAQAQTVKSSLFKRSNDVMLNSGTIVEVSTATVFGCASECVSKTTQTCWSFSFEVVTGRCLVHSTDDVTAPSALVASAGFSYYRRIFRCDDIPGVCQNAGTCADTSDGFQCQCPGWRYEGRMCQDRIYFYLQHKSTSKYLKSSNIVRYCCSASHHEVNMTTAPHMDGLWYELDAPTNKVKLRANTTGMYLGHTTVQNYCYGKDPGYGAETWVLTVLSEYDGSGRRLTHIRNDNNLYFMTWDGSKVTGSTTESTATQWYYVKA